MRDRRIQWMFISLLLMFATSFGGCTLAGGTDEAERSAYQRGLDAFAEHDYMTALAAFQDAVRIEDEEARGYRGQGLVYLHEGNYYNAISMFSRCLDAIRRGDGDETMREDVLLYTVEAYRQNGQLDLARDICDELIEVEDRRAQALILRGELSVAEQRVAEAEEDFRQALEVDDSYSNYLRIYESYEALNRRGDGAELLYEAIAREPRTAGDTYEVGRIYYVLGETEMARQYLSRARDAGEDRAGLLLARISLDAGDVSGARTVYSALLQDADRASLGYNGLVLCDIADGNLERAMEDVQAGLACEDGSAREELLFNEVILYEKQLDFDTAREKMTAFLQLYPGNADAVRENLFLQNR